MSGLSIFSSYFHSEYPCFSASWPKIHGALSFVFGQHGEVLLLGIGVLVFAVLIFLLNVQTYKLRKKNIELDLKNSQFKKNQSVLKLQKKVLNKRNQALKQANKELKEKDRIKNALLRVVAHDLCAPFNNIRGLGDLLEIQGPLNTEQLNSLKLLKEIVKDSSSMIQRMLDLNTIENGTVEVKPEEVDLFQIIDQSISQFQPAADEKGLRFIRPEQPLLFKTDKNLFLRAFNNLLSNAVKFSPLESVIEVELEDMEKFVEVRVKDQGEGIPEKERKKMFRMFSKLSPRPVGNEKSTGLGLAIVKGIMHLLDGTVKYRENSPRGSVFVLRLYKNAEPSE